MAVIRNWVPPDMETPKRASRSKAHTELCGNIGQYLTSVGAWHVRLAGGIYQRSGLPDIMGFMVHPVHGVPVAFFIEVKTGSGRLKQNQKDIRDELIQCGGWYIEAHSLDDVHNQFFKWNLVSFFLS